MSDFSFVVSSGGVAPGAYGVEFIGISNFEEHLEQYGPAVMLRWRVLSGESAGAEPTRICSRKMSPKSTLFKFAVALRGAPLKAGERFAFDEVIGVRGTLIVEPTDSGGGRVSAFIKG